MERQPEAGKRLFHGERGQKTNGVSGRHWSKKRRRSYAAEPLILVAASVIRVGSRSQR